ncbi:AAA family ATPase [Streptomyces sp. NPDC088921]|uniref:NACHT and WD repeat domain-containing protein n=1 Tax=unclassified Streptomyces TaxID=2593676 RepID=UPI00342802DA
MVTGRAGAGKSALLGHILLHTRTRLRDLLIRHGHLQPLPQGVVCPDPFDVVAHLAGLTLARTVELVANAADLPDVAGDAASGRPDADLADRLIEQLQARGTRLTLLLDALDEAEQPLTIANVLLRPLISLATIRLIIGTRSSTREGPDLLAPADTDLLDALRPPPTSDDAESQHADHVQCVTVGQDREAFAGYLRAKLTAAQLNIDDKHIANTVRLLAGHRQPGAEPQQFLYVRLAAHELLRNPRLITDPTPLLGQNHRQLFARALDRLHHSNPAYTPLLQALGLAQGRGIPDHGNIWAICARALAHTPTDISSAIPQLLHDAAPYIALDQEYGQTVYRLAHRTFAEHFINAPGTTEAHAALCTALTKHTAQTLDTSTDETTDAMPSPGINPYIRHHLAGHARLGAPAGSFQTLAEHLGVLDTLDLASIAAAANHVPSQALPPAVAGTVLLQHHAHSSPTSRAWRQWWRRLGTTYIQGTAPPTEAISPAQSEPSAAVLTASVQRRQLSLQLAGHTDVRAVLGFPTADGTPRLATTGTGYRDGRVRIWNPATGQQDREIDTEHPFGVSVMVGFTGADGTPRLATTSADGQWRHYNAATLRPGGQIDACNSDGRVRIWNPATGQQDREIDTDHRFRASAMVGFTAADGTPRLATIVGSDRRVRILNPATGQQDSDIHTDRSRGVHRVVGFTETDGTPRLATTSADYGDGKVRILDPYTGRHDGDIQTNHLHAVTAVVGFSAADGTPRLATTGANDVTVRILDPATGRHDGDIHTDHPFRSGRVGGFHRSRRHPPPRHQRHPLRRREGAYLGARSRNVANTAVRYGRSGAGRRLRPARRRQRSRPLRNTHGMSIHGDKDCR